MALEEAKWELERLLEDYERLEKARNEVEKKLRALLPEVPIANVWTPLDYLLSYARRFWHSQETCPSSIMETNCYEWPG